MTGSPARLRARNCRCFPKDLESRKSRGVGRFSPMMESARPHSCTTEDLLSLLWTLPRAKALGGKRVRGRKQTGLTRMKEAWPRVQQEAGYHVLAEMPQLAPPYSAWPFRPLSLPTPHPSRASFFHESFPVPFRIRPLRTRRTCCSPKYCRHECRLERDRSWWCKEKQPPSSAARNLFPARVCHTRYSCSLQILKGGHETCIIYKAPTRRQSSQASCVHRLRLHPSMPGRSQQQPHHTCDQVNASRAWAGPACDATLTASRNTSLRRSARRQTPRALAGHGVPCGPCIRTVA